MKTPRVIKLRPEQDIQIAVFSHITLRAEKGVFAFHVPNQGKRSFYVGEIMKRMGVRSGVPDIVAVKDGRMHCLELKAGRKSKRSDNQISTMNCLEHAGALVATAHGLEEALYTLEYWGLLKRDFSRIPKDTSTRRVPEAVGVREG